MFPKVNLVEKNIKIILSLFSRPQLSFAYSHWGFKSKSKVAIFSLELFTLAIREEFHARTSMEFLSQPVVFITHSRLVFTFPTRRHTTSIRKPFPFPQPQAPLK